MEVLLSRQLKIMFTFLLTFFFWKASALWAFQNSVCGRSKKWNFGNFKDVCLARNSHGHCSSPLKCLPVYGTLSCDFLFVFSTELFSLACNTLNTTLLFERESWVFYFSFSFKKNDVRYSYILFIPLTGRMLIRSMFLFLISF